MDKAFIAQIKQRFGLIGHSDRLDAALQVAIQVAATDMSVLIHGPSGCGKESFSKIIHSLSKRKHRTFIAVNCGAIPEGTIDSELFGHEKGSFTGAHESRKGYFETANKGTIFLDEAAEMPLSTQARLLRVLESGEYIRVGASRPQQTDVRVVAATHVDLYKAMEEKKFREDLYYRLNTVPIYVPALSERREDVVLLFNSFVIDACERYKRPSLLLDDSAVELLEQAHFPGNIRQLKNIAEQVSLLEKSGTLSAEALRAYLPQRDASLPALMGSPSSEQPTHERELLYKLLFELRHDVHELKRLTYQILQRQGDNKTLLSEYGGLFEEVSSASSSSAALSSSSAALSSSSAALSSSSAALSSSSAALSSSSAALPSSSAALSSSSAALSSSSAALSSSSLDKSYRLPKRLDKKVVEASSHRLIEDITHEHSESEESFSLQSQEREMIARALRKYAHKRKLAAEELGISERTLYRKIKYYGLST